MLTSSSIGHRESTDRYFLLTLGVKSELLGEGTSPKRKIKRMRFESHLNVILLTTQRSQDLLIVGKRETYNQKGVREEDLEVNLEK